VSSADETQHPPQAAAPRGRLVRLADLAFRRRRTVLAAWVVALVGAFGLSSFAGEWSAEYTIPGSESKQAADLLTERFPERQAESLSVVWQAAAGAGDGAVRERVDSFLTRAERLDGVGDGVTATDAQISRDGTIAVVRVPLTESAGEVPVETGERLLSMAERANAHGLRVEVGGDVINLAQRGEISSEVVGMAIAAVILLLTFGTVVATGLPLASALFGLGISSALIGLLAAVLDVPDWGPSMAAMIGIGVGIDYALLILTRFRSALAASGSPRAAVAEALATAGRSVLIAGTTVVIALMGLLVMGLDYMNGAALGSILAVLVVMAASVTLLPALLGFAGHRVNRLRIPGTGREAADADRRPAARWARAVQRRPWTAAIAGTLVLLALAVPVGGLQIGFPDDGNDPAHTETRQAYDLTSRGFGAGANGPLVLAAQLPDGSAARGALDRLAERLRAEPGVTAVSAPAVNRAGDTGVLTVTPADSPQSEETEALVHRLRDEVLPGSGLQVAVGGATAQAIDQSDAVAGRLPLFIGTVVGLSLLLLLMAFRSLAVALKAGAMNLLSIGAAYGVVAFLAEGGWAGQLVGIDTATPVPPFIPVLMFAILFGLSMDYEVFLLSRVREEFLARRDTGRAVTQGLSHTARVITAAAAIMVAVFGAFALSDDIALKLIGIGLAAAIAIDATLVRMVLVPAVMQLLGDRSWWLPRWMDRVLPRAELERPAPQPA
jgi:RND superfamily putative drug exporter